MQARQAPWPPMDAARRLSAAIPGAQLRVIEGDHVLPWGNDQQAVLEALSQFLAAEPEGPTTAPGTHADAGPPSGLSERETEVLRLLAQGQSNKEIAGELSLSVHTVERHLANIYAKIGARGRTDAAAYAHKNGLV
jgi:DNA-binding NarL/FixJ family response regulator